MKEFKDMMRTYRKVKRYSNKINSSINKFSKVVDQSTKKKNKPLNLTRKPINYQGISLDNMTGHQFEQFLADMYRDLGYKVKKTDPSGDYGADLILNSNDERRVIQAKRYSQKVGVRAIQEISASRRYYNANSTAVITSNYFTKAALELADINDVILIDRDSLIALMSKRDELKSEKNNTSTKKPPKNRSRREDSIHKVNKNKFGFLDRLFKK